MKARVRSYEEILSMSTSGATEDGWSTSAKSGLMFAPAMTRFCGQTIEVEPRGGRPGVYYGTTIGYNWAEEWLDFSTPQEGWTRPMLAAIITLTSAALGTIDSDTLGTSATYFFLFTFIIGCVLPAYHWWKQKLSK